MSASNSPDTESFFFETTTMNGMHLPSEHTDLADVLRDNDDVLKEMLVYLNFKGCVVLQPVMDNLVPWFEDARAYINPLSKVMRKVLKLTDSLIKNYRARKKYMPEQAKEALELIDELAGRFLKRVASSKMAALKDSQGLQKKKKKTRFQICKRIRTLIRPTKCTGVHPKWNQIEFNLTENIMNLISRNIPSTTLEKAPQLRNACKLLVIPSRSLALMSKKQAKTNIQRCLCIAFNNKGLKPEKTPNKIQDLERLLSISPLDQALMFDVTERLKLGKNSILLGIKNIKRARPINFSPSLYVTLLIVEEEEKL
ncbi:hypothetical protein HDV05_005790 [Chytridiales sp. JEL 0842]|nr:hypothetical protein HDV05_005790 [Chytridiales sp. JEL 0842]